MHDLVSMITALRRPRILNTAAQHGARQYRRSALRTLLPGPLPRSGDAILQLLALERELDETRRACAADYSPKRHLTVMIALLGEARLMLSARI